MCLQDSRSWKPSTLVSDPRGADVYHLGILPDAPSTRLLPVPTRYGGRFEGVGEEVKASMLAFLERLTATHAPSTVSSLASELAAFGRFLASLDEPPASLAELDRRRHIEPYLAATARARRLRDNEPIGVEERRNRVIALSRFLADITEWDWHEAPTRRLVFPRDVLLGDTFARHDGDAHRQQVGVRRPNDQRPARAG